MLGTMASTLPMAAVCPPHPLIVPLGILLTVQDVHTKQVSPLTTSRKAACLLNK